MHDQSSGLHMTGFYVCCGISIVVFFILMYSLIKFRQSKKTYFHKSLPLEIFWTVVPFFILIALALPVINMFLHA